jgi:hypothetical protein
MSPKTISRFRMPLLCVCFSVCCWRTNERAATHADSGVRYLFGSGRQIWAQRQPHPGCVPIHGSHHYSQVDISFVFPLSFEFKTRKPLTRSGTNGVEGLGVVRIFGKLQVEWGSTLSLTASASQYHPNLHRADFCRGCSRNSRQSWLSNQPRRRLWYS